jgi:PqqA peptide cyclase
VDWGGCRCQALAVVGDAAATDPACALSPKHAVLRALADDAASQPAPDFVYRRMTPQDKKTALAATTS